MCLLPTVALSEEEAVNLDKSGELWMLPGVEAPNRSPQVTPASRAWGEQTVKTRTFHTYSHTAGMTFISTHGTEGTGGRFKRASGCRQAQKEFGWHGCLWPLPQHSLGLARGVWVSENLTL